MKHISLSAVFGLALIFSLSACKCPCSCGKSSAIQLFNGQDLKGWKYVLADAKVKQEDVWSVKEGAIICKGEPLGFLYTDRTFTNFRLMVEYRWAPGAKPGNSGIFSRINQKFSALPRCVETQLMHGSAGDVLTLQGMQLGTNQSRYFFIKNHALAGDISGVKQTDNKEKAPGEWNHLEILAQGSKYTVWMNGQQVNEANGVEVVAGPVGLQSEGGEVHFRKVSLVPLP